MECCCNITDVHGAVRGSCYADRDHRTVDSHSSALFEQPISRLEGKGGPAAALLAWDTARRVAVNAAYRFLKLNMT